MSATLGVLDRALYALFARQADRTRHDPDRKRYRGARLDVSFDVFLARVYGASWVAFGAVAVFVLAAAALLPTGVFVPLTASSPVEPVVTAALALGVPAGLLAKRATVWAGGHYLGLLARARRSDEDRKSVV